MAGGDGGGGACRPRIGEPSGPLQPLTAAATANRIYHSHHCHISSPPPAPPRPVSFVPYPRGPLRQVPSAPGICNLDAPHYGLLGSDVTPSGGCIVIAGCSVFLGAFCGVIAMVSSRLAVGVTRRGLARVLPSANQLLVTGLTRHHDDAASSAQVHRSGPQLSEVPGRSHVGRPLYTRTSDHRVPPSPRPVRTLPDAIPD